MQFGVENVFHLITFNTTLYNIVSFYIFTFVTFLGLLYFKVYLLQCNYKFK